MDRAARSLLAATGWAPPDDDLLPTGAELVEQYLQPLSAFPLLKTPGRERAPFVVRLATGEEILARAVIDASGTWRTPNPLGAAGLPARGVGPAGAGTADALPARGALGTDLRLLVDTGRVESVTGYAVHTVRATAASRVELTALDGRTLTADRVVAATGFRPDHAIAEELRLDLDPILGSTRALAPLIDPNEHSCGTVRPHGVDELAHPEPGYYVVGMKSYGRAPTFLMATGYEQARSIVAAVAGDWSAAREVHLELPETGVRSAGQGSRRATTSLKRVRRLSSRRDGGTHPDRVYGAPTAAPGLPGRVASRAS